MSSAWDTAVEVDEEFIATLEWDPSTSAARALISELACPNFRACLPLFPSLPAAICSAAPSFVPPAI